ncbi:MAG: iron-sulfur cluster assembly accessory protein [Phycisphaerales bacterium]|jgi:iron-sulfur cluster assembly protein|nr:iron-sulfur cluster assembly accessory protein [Phycisphaerales bacterium]MDP7087317.1 iron-sulfur cluster assembly accessory protein [Phycisphaerales bacterium]MDP7189691.1 iron-sulfur cluster assembly accessory protein [Phycisphaerales bacterium]MDP7573497.1 iron-sulfur cluster assembly accessory protein [Phycisphaerales bacterium]HJN79878.1 iron-sulfur cluster assembly accessory protein [Phycisphaerales bacterium]|tara:strand:- start:298 stop:669 length:372 start_codon:yes stop_codon:yes gene_type:complete
MSVTITETAAREIATIVRQQDLDTEAIRLRVGVKGGGCSGFSYLLDLTETVRDSDEAWDFDYTLESKDGDSEPFKLRVICDPKSLLYLNGTEIDFKDEIMGRGFIFNNPNATSSCGCGSSFSA